MTATRERPTTMWTQRGMLLLDLLPVLLFAALVLALPLISQYRER